MPAHVNTYSGGIDRDSSKNKYQNTSYYNMKNMRLTSFEELSNGTVQSIEGNTLSISVPTGYESDIIIGQCVIRNWLVVWTTNDNSEAGGRGTIWKTDLSIATSVWTKIYQSNYLYFTTLYPIFEEAIGFYESSDIIKVYWTDNHNMIRHINIMDTYDDATYDVTLLDILSDVTFSKPVIVNISGGNLPVGKIQYAYQYYNISGIETTYSPLTSLIHLTKSSESLTGTNISQYEGTDALDDSGNPSISGKSVTIQINDVDEDYDMIRVVAILYRNLNQEPDIHIVGEYELFDGMFVTDMGNYLQGTITLNAFRTLGNHELYCKTISQKGNKTLIGNITEKFFDIDELLGYTWDARSYRFGPTQDNVLSPYTLSVSDIAHINIANTTNDNIRILIPTPVAIAALSNDTMSTSGAVTQLLLDYTETVLYNTDSVVWTKFRSAGNITFTYISDNEIELHITNFNAWALTQPGFGVTWTVDDVLAFIDDVFIYGTYESTTLGHDVDFTGLGTGSNIVFAGDALSFLVTANVGDYFTDFVAFEPVTGAVQISINYDYTIDYSYSFASLVSADFEYIRQEPNPNPANWIFDVHKLSAGFFFTTIDPFSAANITAITLTLDTEYTYDSGAATPRIVVYNSKTQTENNIAHDALVNIWPDTTYTLGAQPVPDNHDCINPFNYDFLYGELGVGGIQPQIDEYASYWSPALFLNNPDTMESYNANGFKWRSDLTTLGGEGPNIRFTFDTQAMVINESTDTRIIQPDMITLEKLTSYDSYKNPIREATVLSNKRDEVYRYGIVFINTRGQESFAKWIADIKMPTVTEYPLTTSVGRTTTAYALYVKFEVNVEGLYDIGVRGFKIVRVERTENDRSIYSQGIISNMFYHDCAGDRYHDLITGFIRATNSSIVNGVSESPASYVRQRDVYQFISPEVSYFKALNHEDGDYIKKEAMLVNRTAYLAGIDDSVSDPYIEKFPIDVDGSLEMTTNITGVDDYANTFNSSKYGWESISRYQQTNPLATILVCSDILDGTMAGIVEWGAEDENLITFNSTPGNKYILNRSIAVTTDGTTVYQGPSGTCFIIVTEDNIGLEPTPVGDYYNLALVDYKRGRIAASQYGGLHYEARQQNIYIECGHYQLVTSTDTTINTSVYGGDTYIDFFDHLKTIWECDDNDGDGTNDIDRVERYCAIVSFPVESHINLAAIHGARYAQYYTNTLIHAIREEEGTWKSHSHSGDYYTLTMENNMYLYNSAYSQQNTTKQYFVKPSNWESVVHDDTLIKISLEKYPREEVDAYLKYLTDNEKLLPTEFGPINDMFLFKNYMIVFMDHAMGTISIDERALLPIQNNSILELGAANNLQHFEFISNISGSIHPQSIEYCGDGFIWYDAYNGSIGYYNGNTQDLGLTKGMSSVIRRHTDLLKRPDGSFSVNQLYGGNVICKQNHKYKETLVSFMYSEFAVLGVIAADELTFWLDRSPGHYDNKRILINGIEYMAERITHASGGTGVVGVTVVDNTGLAPLSASWILNRKYHIVFVELAETYTFSSIINAFMSQLDIYPTWYIQHNRQLYDVYGQFAIWKEFVGNYCQLYGEYRNGEIEYVINPKGSLVCLFNNFEYASEAFNDDNENLISETWDSVRLWNDYQYSASTDYNCVFTSGTDYIRRNPPDPHELETGDLVSFSGSSLPATVSISIYYYVHKVDDTNFQISPNNTDVYVTFASDTSGLFHKIDVPLSVIAEPVNDKRRFRTWRIKDIRDYRGFIQGRLKPRMRDTYLRLLFKYLHADNKRLLMHDLVTYCTIPRETTGNNQ